MTVKTGKEMERQNINNARDFVRDEPAFRWAINHADRHHRLRHPRRRRERVRVEIDGVKVPDFPGSNAGAGTYTRDFVDMSR